MAKQKATTVDEGIAEAQYTLAKYEFVKSHYPDATLGYYYAGFVTKSPIFQSKTVNSSYNKLLFDQVKPGPDTKLLVIPYSELEFEYKGNKEVIRINSKPKTSTLCYIDYEKGKPSKYNFKDVSLKKVIKFSKLITNLKNNDFDPKMLNDCRIQIINFIKNHPGIKLDKKYMDERLKKLLLFI